MPNVTQVITIGRNVGDKPLSSGDWSLFKRLVRSALSRYGSIIQDPLEGAQAGVWEGVVAEDAATFVCLTPETFAFTVRPLLKVLACRFQQEAIGFIVVAGDRHLIETTAEERQRAALGQDGLGAPTLRFGDYTPDGFVVGV